MLYHTQTKNNEIEEISKERIKKELDKISNSFKMKHLNSK